MNIDQFIVRRELIHRLELEPRELSSVNDNLLRRLLAVAQGTCINRDNGYIYRIHEILKSSTGKKRNEDLSGMYQFTVLYSADTIVLRKGEPLYGLRVDVVDKLGVHCSYNDIIIMFIGAEYLEHNYMDTIRKGSTIDVVILEYNYAPFSKRISCLGSGLQYYTVHPMTTNTVTLLPRPVSQDALSVLNELNSVPNTVESVYYRLSDPFWPLSSEADMSSIVKEACSQLPLLRYSKSNAPKGYSVNGLELSEPTDRVLNVYTDVPQSISTDTVLILPLNTVIAERELINTLCSKGNCTVYSPYIKMGEWSASDVLSKSYLFILIQGVDNINNVVDVYNVIDSVVNGIIKRINTQLYTVTLLSERYSNVKESPNFTEYFNCQNGIVQAHREFLDSVK